MGKKEDNKSVESVSSVSSVIQTPYKQTEVGVIPSDWEVKTLGEVAYVFGGGTPSTFEKRYWNGNINWFTPTEIGVSKYVFESERKITSEGLANSSARILPIGTILLTSRAGIGDVSILEVEASTNQGFQSLISKEIIHNEYLYYVMLTLKNVFLQNASGSTFLEISPKKVRSVPIPLPPTLPEQTAIATALSDADALINQLEQLLTKKRNIKTGAMQELLRPKEGWVECELKQIVKQFIIPMRDKPKKFSGNIPWCRIEDFDGKYLSNSKSNQFVDEKVISDMNLKVMPIETLIVSCSADLGRCAILKRELVTNQTFIGLVVNDNSASNEFLYYFFTYNAQRLNQLSSGTTISYLSREQFENLKVVVPKSKSEQTRIAQILTDMDNEIEKLEKQIEKYKMLKQGMMQSLLTGKIRLV